MVSRIASSETGFKGPVFEVDDHEVRVWHKVLEVKAFLVAVVPRPVSNFDSGFGGCQPKAVRESFRVRKDENQKEDED